MEKHDDLEVEMKFSCEGFPSDTTTSDSNRECKSVLEAEVVEHTKCSPLPSSSSSSSTSPIGSERFQSACRINLDDSKIPPNLSYETAIAKSILKQHSSLSGDNLFDHISDIIKRVIDERPPNVIDFFEEYSRSVREQKFHLPERFPPDAIYTENRRYRMANRLLMSMNLPYIAEEDHEGDDDDGGMSEDSRISQSDIVRATAHSPKKPFRFFFGRIQHQQFAWNQCGFSISTDDIFQLAVAMNKLQTHPNIMQCRFWGVINGLKKSYYIVEAALTLNEITNRVEELVRLIEEKQAEDIKQLMKPPLPYHVGDQLSPGKVGWENYSPDELNKMLPVARDIPTAEVVSVFEIPPETVGRGSNRFTYFVVNSLSDEWTELPIVTTQQIVASRKMKKYFSGDLEEDIDTYPCFPGKEKHYLRAMIGRITAGSYIAPMEYYRKMTKLERNTYEGTVEESDEEEEEEEGEDGVPEEEDELDNDHVLLLNEAYIPVSLDVLTNPDKWVHVRPNILEQGRVVWYDTIQARRDCENEMKRLIRLRELEELGMHEGEEEHRKAGNEEEDEEEEAEEEEDSYIPEPEIGPPIMSPCNHDAHPELNVLWQSRNTCNYVNKSEQILVMQSNLWPGSYTFISRDEICDSIYMGWGHKYNARNMPFVHLPKINEEYPHTSNDFIESTDPTVEEEEAYRLSLLRKQLYDMGEELDEFDEDIENDDKTLNQSDVEQEVVHK